MYTVTVHAGRNSSINYYYYYNSAYIHMYSTHAYNVCFNITVILVVITNLTIY